MHERQQPDVAKPAPHRGDHAAAIRRGVGDARSLEQRERRLLRRFPVRAECAAVPVSVYAIFTGTPGSPDCQGKSVSALAQQYRGLAVAAKALGYPSVHASADFTAPLRFGDQFRIEMTTEAVGDTSISSRYRVLKGTQPCAELKIVTAVIDLERFAPVAVPADVRAAFERIR